MVAGRFGHYGGLMIRLAARQELSHRRRRRRLQPFRAAQQLADNAT
jgi:hypothetical protein